MGLISKNYDEVRHLMKPGDVIAFGGKTHFSNIIKAFTLSPVSHIAVVLHTKIVADDEDRYFNQLIESTSLDGFSGVQITRASTRVKYDGEVWWMPLSDEIRSRFNEKAFFTFLLRQEGHEYDIAQTFNAAVDGLDSLPFGIDGPTWNEEDYSKFFCSELVAAGLEKSGAIGRVNASEVTPIDLCRWKIYQNDYYQLNGAPKTLSRYNTANPTDWQ